MSDEEKVQSPETGAPEAPVLGDSLGVRKPKYWPIVISVIAVGAIAVLIAFLHWHEEPTFCNVLCHQPMDRYVEGYYSGDDSLGAAQHEEDGVTCLGCHWPQAKMMDLVHEVVLWVSDGFTDPLEDKTEIATDEFCGKCHDGETAPTKESATEGWAYDPHNISEDVEEHQTAGADGGSITCSDCHKMHKTSTLMCAECHSEYFNEEDGTIPDGWTVPEENETKAATADAYGIYDMHAGDTYVQFSEMHETAGSDGGTITCADCHETKTIVCAKCHDGVYDEDVPEGWTLGTSEAKEATAEKYGVFDMHAGDTYVQFSTMHETAGSDGGTITCMDCHETQTIACGQCHANTFSEDLPEGWSIPEGAIDVSALAAETEEEEANESESADSEEVVASDVTYVDGTYTGTGTGIGGEFEVTVTVEGGKIASVEVGENSETQGIGSNAIETLPDEIVAANGIEGVDAYSGASVTSSAIFSAVESALADAVA